MNCTQVNILFPSSQSPSTISLVLNIICVYSFPSLVYASAFYYLILVLFYFAHLKMKMKMKISDSTPFMKIFMSVALFFSSFPSLILSDSSFGSCYCLSFPYSPSLIFNFGIFCCILLSFSTLIIQCTLKSGSFSLWPFLYLFLSRCPQDLSAAPFAAFTLHCFCVAASRISESVATSCQAFLVLDCVLTSVLFLFSPYYRKFQYHVAPEQHVA